MPIYKTNIQKDGKYKYRVCINYTDKAGIARRVERKVFGAAEAKETERRLLQEYKGDTPTDMRKTVQVLYDEYIVAQGHEVRASSLAKTKTVAEKYILPILGNVRLDRLCASTLQSWKNETAELGFSITHKKNIYAVLRAILNYGVKMEYLDRNPLAAVGNFKNKDFTPPKDKIQYYTAEQFKTFLAAARTNAEEINTLDEWGYYVFFAIAYYTGMRKGEINALKWSDIDGNIINVRRSVSLKIKGEQVVETPPKNESSYRDLQMPRPLAVVLSEHKLRQKQNGVYKEDLRICGGMRCLPDTSIEKRNTAFAKAAELPHIRVHDFRHSHVSLLANEGINIQEIARRLGHARIEQTWNTYSHLYPREEERAVAIIDRIFAE